MLQSFTICMHVLLRLCFSSVPCFLWLTSILDILRLFKISTSLTISYSPKILEETPHFSNTCNSDMAFISPLTKIFVSCIFIHFLFPNHYCLICCKDHKFCWNHENIYIYIYIYMYIYIYIYNFIEKVLRLSKAIVSGYIKFYLS